MPNNNVHLVIDGDLLAFKAAAVNEDRSISCFHPVTQEHRTARNRTEFKASLLGDYAEWNITDVQEPKPIEYAHKIAREMIAGWLNRAEASTFEIVLSGPNNFRLDIPLPTRYKSNRDGGIRPLQLKPLKKWLEQEYNAVVTDGYEADDYLAMCAYAGEQSGKKIVQATIDKDARGYTSWLLELDGDGPVERIEGFGELVLKEGKLKGKGQIWMLAQSLLGDKADGYRPADLSGQKFGDVACYNLLKDCTNVKEAMSAIYSQYFEWYSSPITYTTWDGKGCTKDAVGIWQMYFDAARMLRWPGDKIDLRKVLMNYGVV